MIDKVIEALKKLPTGTRVGTVELALLAGVSNSAFAKNMSKAVEHKFVCKQLVAAQRLVWFLPYDEADPRFAEDEETADELPPRHNNLYAPRGYTPDPQRLQQLRFADKHQTDLISLFRETLTTAKYVKTGDPLKGLVAFNDMARAVHDAKTTSTFNGAEVDLVIAREYKNISIAIARATSNLKEALDMMAALADPNTKRTDRDCKERT